MEFFKHNTKIDFMAQRKWAALLSAVLFIASMVALMVHGLNWGLDFTGGTQVQLHFPTAANITQIRENLEKAGFADAVVMSYGTSKDVLVTIAPKKNMDASRDTVVSQVTNALPEAKIQQVDYIGP